MYVSKTFENTLNWAISSFFIAYIKEVKNSIPEKINGWETFIRGVRVTSENEVNFSNNKLNKINMHATICTQGNIHVR